MSSFSFWHWMIVLAAVLIPAGIAAVLAYVLSRSQKVKS
ncbi:hypothetical protein SAMN04487782_1082 [Stenotrophomonas maltophilia]|nr:hypothetical protein SAMN04487782_1082 [Stenotrophomonas maltophilia]